MESIRKDARMWAEQERELQQLCYIWVYVGEGKAGVSDTAPSAGGQTIATPPHVMYGSNVELS